MNYQEAMQFVRAADALGCTPGLSRVSELLERLGNPQNQLRCIHIAGTNGKGSTAAMLASVLQAAGYRTGLYTTPHLISYRERICADGEQITEEDFCRAAEIVRDAAAGMQETPSEFERFTPMAFVHFLQKKCDIAVIETGMGGRLDATNVIAHPELDVIVHVALDHTEYLGNTIAEIAAEKAGIIRPGADVILMKQSETVEQVVRKRFTSVNQSVNPSLQPAMMPELIVTEPEQLNVTEYNLEGFHFLYRGSEELFLPMAGSFQQQNVMVALDAVNLLCRKGWKIPSDAVRTGLAQVRWPARFEILQREPLVLLDGAHNADGMHALTDTLKQLLPDQKPVVVMGVLADKEYHEMLKMLLPLAGTFVAAEPDQIRALPAERLAEEARSCAEKIAEENAASNRDEDTGSRTGAVPVLCGGSISDSLQLACSICPPDGVICIAGSLYQAGETQRFFAESESESEE